MRRFGHILLCIVIFSVACSDKGGQTSGPPKPIRLHSIICDDDSYTIDCGGSVEVVFRVEEPKALFNYALSSDKCQVELRLAADRSQRPKELMLTSIRESDTTRGTYHALIADTSLSEMYSTSIHIVIKLHTGELIRSNPIHITTSNYVGGITSVVLRKGQNPRLAHDITFDFDAAAHSFNAHIPIYTTDHTYIAEFETDGVDRIEIDGKVIDMAGTPVDFSCDVDVVAYLADAELRYTLHVDHFTGLPVVSITTPGGQEVWSKDVWIEHSTLWLDGNGRFEDVEGVEVSIRGRGNSTWGYDKKPYAIKFTEKQEVMGMPKHKRWVLLANYMDRTLLRNRVAFFLAEQTSLAWTPRQEFVELILNGKHLGQYLLCEQVRVDNDRIAITEMTPQDNSGDAITGGYLLELDFHYDNEWQWFSQHNTPFAVKFPDEEDLTAEQFTWIQRHIAEAESVLYGNDFASPDKGYAQYIDAQSFIDYWLIYEICVNHELANPGSVYLQKDRNGKLVAGPVWDFDWGTFSYNASPAAQWGLFMTHAWWYDRLFSDEAFRNLARERWQLLKPKFMEVFAFIEAERKYIARSWEENFKLWDINTTINGDERLSFDDAVDRMIRIIEERIDIIDREL
uniref:CotH kinase family protein n=1 Tax=Alistipes sp. TaxID=1872444 RepID=UPI0040563F79